MAATNFQNTTLPKNNDKPPKWQITSMQEPTLVTVGESDSIANPLIIAMSEAKN